jgi:hypothetical protein
MTAIRKLALASSLIGMHALAQADASHDVGADGGLRLARQASGFIAFALRRVPPKARRAASTAPTARST